MCLAERYVASASEPPAVSVYPVGGAAGGGARAQPAHNPWQREERERQAEARRAANRARRYVATPWTTSTRKRYTEIVTM